MKNITYHILIKGGIKIITETAVQKLLDQLYDYMSFMKGEEARYDLLRGIFHEEALIIEYNQQDCRYHNEKNIHRHIAEINYVLSQDPEIKSEGFTVTELNNTISIAGPTAFVKSVYEKRYSDGVQGFNEIGINTLQMARINQKLKIISMASYEK